VIATQIDFGLAVPVCAWCKPEERGAASPSLSHGICLRHLKKLKLEAQGGRVTRTRRSRLAGRPQNDGSSSALPLVF
jgi:hypothetical protein